MDEYRETSKSIRSAESPKQGVRKKRKVMDLNNIVWGEEVREMNTSTRDFLFDMKLGSSSVEGF